MTEISKYNQFINEICSFEWERTILDRNDDEHRYLDANYEPIPLLRLPKYNQLNGDYEKFITTLRCDAYNEILLFENFKIEKVLYRLQEIEIEFNEFWKIWTEILTSLAKTQKEFDYSDVVIIMYLKFKIIDFNTNAYCYDGFNGSFGLITDEFKSDLYDALLLKDGELHHLIYDLKNYLKPIKTPSPAKQTGFDLGLNEKQLKKLYQQLIDEKFLAENTNPNYFINAFNGKVLEVGFEQLVFKPISMLTIFVNAISIKYSLFIDKWVITEIVFKSPDNKQLSRQYFNACTSDKAKRVNKLFENLLNEL